MRFPRNSTTITLFSLLGILTLPALAQQQGPPPRVLGSVQVDPITMAPVQVIRSVNLDATPEAVFRFVTDHQNWPQFFDPIESVKVTGRGKTGSQRTFALAGGGLIKDRIVAFDEPRGNSPGTFAYSVEPGNPYGVEDHLAVIEIQPADGGGAVLHYHQLFNHPDPATISPQIASGTDNIVSQILYRFGGHLRGASHGLDKVAIRQQRVVRASAQRAWQVLGNEWGDVDEWASTISHSQSKGGSRESLAGATRSCEVPGTPGFRETMTVYNKEDLTLAYKVIEGVPPFVQNATNTWTIEPLSEDRLVISSHIALEIAPGTPGMAIGRVKGQFTQLIDLSLDELVHYVETRRPHPRKVAATRAMSGR